MSAQALRIAYIAPEGLEIPPIQGGSVQIYLYNLFNHLRQQHNDVVDPILFCKSSSKNTSFPYRLIRINHSRRSQYLKDVLRKLKRVSVDMIQVDNRPSWIPAIRQLYPKIPIVLNLHSTTFLSQLHITRKHLTSVFRMTTAVVVNSRALARTLVTRFGAIKDRVHVIYPGVDLQAFPSRHSSYGNKRRNAFRAKEACESKFVFLYAGRVIRQKGVHTILRAFRRVYQKYPNTCLYIIGGTHPWERNYRKTIRMLAQGLPVTILPQITQKKLADYYLGADAFLCPSQGFESFGLVNVEAMSTGLPVIGSHQGGIAEIVTRQCGKLIRSYRSSKAFQEAMSEAIENQDHWRTTISMQARARVDAKFIWEQTANRFVKLYLLLSKS